MRSTVYLAVPVMLLMLILQATVLPRFPIWGLTPQLCLLAATSWGLLRGPEEGVVWAFIGGFLLDLYTSGPMGALTLAMMLAVLLVSLVRQNFPASSFFMPLLYAVLATIVFLVAYLILIRLLGHPVTAAAVRDLAALILLDALFMLPIYWLLGQLERLVNPRRVELR